LDVNLYHLEDIAKKSGTPVSTLNEWLLAGILIPEGKAVDSTPIFSDDSLVQIEKINSLIAVGYDSAELRKIVKKVGLPREGENSASGISGKDKYLTVGTLAEKTGVSPRTLKHWEEKGIIEPDLRSSGGFRLYRDYYILFCNLIKDLQLFGYSLEDIKTVSDYFRDFIEIRDNIGAAAPEKVAEKLAKMEEEIKLLFGKMEQLKSGIKRWEDLLKRQKKQITLLKDKNKRRLQGEKP